MDQDLYKRSDAGKKLRDSDVFFDAGPSSKAYETEARVALGPGNHSKRQISRKARELAELGINRPYQDRTAPGVDDFINNVQERINDRSKFRQTN
jgi:hypothetical protein